MCFSLHPRISEFKQLMQLFYVYILYPFTYILIMLCERYEVFIHANTLFSTMEYLSMLAFFMLWVDLSSWRAS